jgi:hypothetical protein
MKIAFVGYGQVGGALADQLQRRGHEVILAAADSNSSSVQKALERNGNLQVKQPLEAVRNAEIVFLATPFQAVNEALEPLKLDLAGKILVDCTNPVGPNLTHGLNSQQSGSEVVQDLLPNTKVTKAFTIYGFENFEDNRFPGYSVKPVMMYCGNDQVAKTKVAALISDLDWEPLDVGDLTQSLHLEHMTLLWIRMVRLQKKSPFTVWAVLQR